MTVKSNWNELMLAGAIRRKRWLTMGAVVMMMVASLASQTAPQPNLRSNRITQDVSSGGIVTLAGTVHPLTQRATDVGAVSSEMQMDSLTLNIGLSAAQQTEVNALLEAQQDQKSGQYHQWLTQQEYGARFGLTDADLSAVTAWLKGQGFSVTGVAKSRNAIHFSGKAWRVESAFHTQLHQFQVDGETRFANTMEIRVPAGIGSVMQSVRGLNNFRLKPQAQSRMAPNYTFSSTQHFLTPGDWATIYGVTSIYSAGYTGTGAHVGVVGQTYAPQADIDHFRTASGLGATNISYVCIDASVSCTASTAVAPPSAGDLGEADLDIEWAGGIAKNATVDFVYAPYNSKLGVFDALQYAVQDYTVPATSSVLPVISMSYGDCESNMYTNGVLNSIATFVTTVGQQAQLQGQTIVVSSGDSGAAGCDAQGVAGSGSATGGAWAGVPLDSPFYTGVGGTTLSGDESTPSSYWNQTSSEPSTALGHIPETVWNDTSVTKELSASGGGVSTVYAQPIWQNLLIAGQTTGRMVPDVAFAASPGHDGYMACSADNNSTEKGTMCANGTFYSSGSKSVFYSYGGTSAGTPSFAGMLTLLTQKYGMLGNINPTLYNLAKVPATYAAVFHDITSGDNIVPCVANTTGCGANLQMGWSATSGYDLATGLGSINGGQLYAALDGLSGPTTSTTALVISPTAPTHNQTVTLVATVGSGSSSVATTPTGAVVFTIDGTAGNAVQLANGSASTTKEFSADGSHPVSVAYGGDITFAKSSFSSVVTVTAVPTYTVAASAGTATVNAGGTIPITLNLVSTNYVGTVSFAISVSSFNGTASNVTASVPPSVTLSNGGNGVSTLTISTSASATKHGPERPWKSGGALIFCAVLLGAPFTLRRKRAIAVVLTALAISLGGFLVACGGGSSSSSIAPRGARAYTVKVTAVGTGTVTNPAPILITVNVP